MYICLLSVAICIGLGEVHSSRSRYRYCTIDQTRCLSSQFCCVYSWDNRNNYCCDDCRKTATPDLDCHLERIRKPTRATQPPLWTSGNNNITTSSHGDIQLQLSSRLVKILTTLATLLILSVVVVACTLHQRSAARRRRALRVGRVHVPQAPDVTVTQTTAPFAIGSRGGDGAYPACQSSGAYPVSAYPEPLPAAYPYPVRAYPEPPAAAARGPYYSQQPDPSSDSVASAPLLPLYSSGLIDGEGRDGGGGLDKNHDGPPSYDDAVAQQPQQTTMA